MKWLEIIELRSVGKHQEQVEQELTELTARVDTDSGPKRIDVYRNLNVSTDWSIHLHYESDWEDLSQNPLGLHLVIALKKFGLVHHSLWRYKGGLK